MKIHSAAPAYPVGDDYICEGSGVPRAREGGKERSRPPGRRDGELSESAQEMRRESASRYPEEGGWAPIPRRAARQAQWAHAHAARSVGSPYDEGEPDPGTRSRGAERWSAGRAPGKDPRRRRRAPRAGEGPTAADPRRRRREPRARGAEGDRRSGGPSGASGPGGRRSRRGPRGGEGPPGGGAARSRSGAKTGRPAGRPEKANMITRSAGTARVSAEGQREQRVGQGC